MRKGTVGSGCPASMAAEVMPPRYTTAGAGSPLWWTGAQPWDMPWSCGRWSHVEPVQTASVDRCETWAGWGISRVRGTVKHLRSQQGRCRV